MATKKTATRSARTRSETAEAFEDVSKAVRSKEILPTAERAIQDSRNTAVRDSVKGVTVDSAVNALTKTSLDVQKTFSSLTELITAKVTELTQLQEAVALERDELEKLHGADVIKSDLAALIADHDAKVFELEAEIALRKSEWAEQKLTSEKTEAELKAELIKARSREVSDYAYNQQILRKKDQDEWSDLVAKRSRDATLKQEVLEKGWTAREESIKANEKTLADLQAQVIAFPEAIKKEKETAVAIATNSLKKDLTNTYALEKKDLETSLSLSKAEVVAAKTTNAALLEQLAKVQAELAKAQEQVTKIAQSALDSASGARALAEVTSMQSRERESGNGRKQ